MKDKKKIFLIGGVILGIVILVVAAILLTSGSNKTKSNDVIKTRNGKVMSNVFGNICQYIAK